MKWTKINRLVEDRKLIMDDILKIKIRHTIFSILFWPALVFAYYAISVWTFSWTFGLSLSGLILFTLAFIIFISIEETFSYIPFKKTYSSLGDELIPCYIGVFKTQDKDYRLRYFFSNWIGFSSFLDSSKKLDPDMTKEDIDKIIKDDLGGYETRILREIEQSEKRRSHPDRIKNNIKKWHGVGTTKIHLLRDKDIDVLEEIEY